jgi:serine protease Do
MPIPVPGRLAEALRRSTVHIRVAGGRAEGSGSGITLPGDRVLTNAHVVRGGPITVEWWEGKTTAATVIKIDRQCDLAVLQVPKLEAPPATLGDSSRLKAGTPVIAVGNPLGFIGALSSGVVHALRPLSQGGPKWIHADVRLAPGSSGGPLADFNGQVLGVNTMIVSSGLALAIPSRTVQHFLLPSTGRKTLGVTIRPVQLRSGGAGLMILEITDNSAAERSSLLPGDILAAVNGRKLLDVDDLQNAMDEAASSLLQVEFYRAGKPELRRVAVELKQEVANAA